MPARSTNTTADRAIDTCDNESLLDIAEGIQAAQHPEIDQMEGWRSAWGESTGPTAMSAGHDMSTTSMSGGSMGAMMRDGAMDELQGINGVAFDQMLLDMMDPPTTGERSIVSTSPPVSVGGWQENLKPQER